MLDNSKTEPFDVTQIDKDIAEVVQGSHDSIRARTRPASLLRRPVGVSDSGSAASGPENNSVDHPLHYVSHPSGVECIIIAEWMNFNLGNALKYIWRSNDKGTTIEDLEKAKWYIGREISRLKRIAEG